MRVFTLMLMLPEEEPPAEVARLRRVLSELLEGITRERYPERGKFRVNKLDALTPQGASGMAQWGDVPVIAVEPPPPASTPGGTVH